MAKTRTQAQLFAELADRYGVAVAEAFIRAMDDIRGAAEIQRLTAAIEAGQIEEALTALHIDVEAYDPLLDAIRDAYTDGGRTAVQGLPSRQADGTALVIRFNGRNPVAERWLRDHSSQLITRIVDDQRQAVRAALQAGMEAGANPRTTALRIVGTINRATGKRTGGILGLTTAQSQYVANARAELTAGDPASLRNYLTRTARNRVFDRTVKKALRDGTPVPSATIGKATLAYEARLLNVRGRLIGTHETFAALAEARHEAYRQAVESGQVEAGAITKVWRHFPSEAPRMQHVAMAGESVRFDRPFIMADGTQMMFPHDPAAPISHTAFCSCQADYRIDFLRNLR